MHTAQLMAMLANINRAEDADVVSWEHWHPQYDPPEAPEATPEILIGLGFKPVVKAEGVTSGS
jgi:hypothetical protein